MDVDTHSASCQISRMDRIEADKFISKAIANAIAGGCHQLDIVAILEANKFSLLQQAFEANKPKPSKLFPVVMEEGGNSN